MANSIGKFCVQMLKLSKGEDASSNEIYPIPLCTANLDPSKTTPQPIRVTCLDAMAISAFQDKLRAASTDHGYLRYGDDIITQLFTLFIKILYPACNSTNSNYFHRQ